MNVVVVVAENAALVLGLVTCVWLLSLALKDASIVDVFWGLGFTVVAWATWWRSERGDHATLLAALVTLWGVRLAGYIGVRNAGKSEDHRYQAFRAKYQPFWIKSYFIVFLLQGFLLLIVSLPVQLGMQPRPAGLGPADAAGIAVYIVGLLFEVVGDAQLALFKRAQRRAPAQAGQVMDRGLWRYTRHPNYFGEFLLWWGIGIVALSTPGAWWSALIGPAMISFLLLRVSGVPILEAAMKERRPGYAAYVARTAAFFPRPPGPRPHH